jgi:dTDP-4-amino-4,6-dideoxygalactose transaminase
VPVKVPFLDLSAQARSLGGAVETAVAEVLASQRFILGPAVDRFEAAMAAYCGVPHAIGVGSGTDALVLTLRALGVGPGRVVVTTPFSFFATASAVARLGGRVLFADVDPRTLNLDPAAVEAVLGAGVPGVVGLLPVHVFGRLAPMEDLAALASRHGLWIVEDAAQAVGARSAAGMAGAIGRAGCLSFYPTKNLGGVGDGGMVLTADEALATAVRRDRNQGMTSPYQHASLGACSRLDSINAAALHVKLAHLDDWNARRRAVAARYAEGFRDAGLAGGSDAAVVLPEPAGAAHVFHQYVVRARARAALAEHLASDGVAPQVYYRPPLHRQPPLAEFALAPPPLGHAERAAGEVLALPLHPELDDAQVAHVVGACARFYATGAPAL